MINDEINKNYLSNNGVFKYINKLLADEFQTNWKKAIQISFINNSFNQIQERIEEAYSKKHLTEEEVFLATKRNNLTKTYYDHNIKIYSRFLSENVSNKFGIDLLGVKDIDLPKFVINSINSKNGLLDRMIENNDISDKSMPTEAIDFYHDLLNKKEKFLDFNGLSDIEIDKRLFLENISCYPTKLLEMLEQQDKKYSTQELNDMGMSL